MFVRIFSLKWRSCLHWNVESVSKTTMCHKKMNQFNTTIKQKFQTVRVNSSYLIGRWTDGEKDSIERVNTGGIWEIEKMRYRPILIFFHVHCMFQWTEKIPCLWIYYRLSQEPLEPNRHVCTHSDAFSMLNSNMDTIFNLFFV